MRSNEFYKEIGPAGSKEQKPDIKYKTSHRHSKKVDITKQPESKAADDLEESLNEAESRIAKDSKERGRSLIERILKEEEERLGRKLTYDEKVELSRKHSKELTEAARQMLEDFFGIDSKE